VGAKRIKNKPIEGRMREEGKGGTAEGVAASCDRGGWNSRCERKLVLILAHREKRALGVTQGGGDPNDLRGLHFI